MMPVSSIIGLASCAYISAVIVLALLPISRRSVAMRIGAGLVLIGAMFIPIGGLPLAGYVRGAVGDPSMTTLMLITCIAVRRIVGRELFDHRNLRAAMTLVIAGAIVLYPMAMGLGPYDPFRLGFGSWWFSGVLLTLALGCWWKRLELPLACITLGVAAHGFGVMESTNLWTYLIDPIAVLLAAGWIVERGVRRAAQSRRKQEAAA